MPHASIVVPAYNAMKTLPETVQSLCAQTYEDFEIVIVDDGSADGTAAWVQAQDDPRIRLSRQVNRGLAGARNGGIIAAKGSIVGFCDADDLWEPTKLAAHVAHLEQNPHIGVSYSASLLVDENNESLGLTQSPRTTDITTQHVLMRNPVGNGSAPVIRAETLRDIAFRPAGETRDWFFDENLRQSEDIECWVRIALTTKWAFGGIAEPLTRYRIIANGLSANLGKQLETWEAMADKVTQIAPDFAAKWVPAARAYQLRYLARRALTLGDARAAVRLQVQAMGVSRHPIFHEPAKTFTTLAATGLMLIGGERIIARALGRRAA